MTSLPDARRGLRENDSACTGRLRTLNLMFQPVEGGYMVYASGEAMPVHGSRSVYGRLEVGKETIQEWIDELYDVWSHEIIDRRAPRGSGGGAWYPLAERVNMNGVVDKQQLDEVWRRLARAGHKLFRLLFELGDPGLRDLGGRLAAVLRECPQVISIMSDDFVVPWAMLYVPIEPDETFPPGATINPEGFWGYRHLVEHTFEIPQPAESDILIGDRITVGAYTDDRIDNDRAGEPGRTVAPVLNLLRRRADLRARSTVEDLEADFRGVGRGDHLIYFCCHCVADVRRGSHLRLSNDTPITASDFRTWLADNPLTHRPLVIINACRAARLSSNSPGHFGHALLTGGAGSLLGPSMAMPMMFARTYVNALLCRILRPRVPLGPAMRDLTRHFADVRGNPLGLAYAVYHGIDTHFCPEHWNAHGVVAEV